MDPNKYLSVESVGKTFETRKGDFVALAGIDLALRKGEFVTLIGHSGCGKSTLLNLVAGLLEPSEGTIILAEREVAGPGPDRGVVFQNHSLLPWLLIGWCRYCATSTGVPSRNVSGFAKSLSWEGSR